MARGVCQRARWETTSSGDPNQGWRDLRINHTQGGTRWTPTGSGKLASRRGVGGEASYRFSFLSRRSVHGRRDFHFHAGAVWEVLICGRRNTVSLAPPTWNPPVFIRRFRLNKPAVKSACKMSRRLFYRPHLMEEASRCRQVDHGLALKPPRPVVRLMKMLIG